MIDLTTVKDVSKRGRKPKGTTETVTLGSGDYVSPDVVREHAFGYLIRVACDHSKDVLGRLRDDVLPAYSDYIQAIAEDQKTYAAGRAKGLLPSWRIPPLSDIPSWMELGPLVGQEGPLVSVIEWCNQFGLITTEALYPGAARVFPKFVPNMLPHPLAVQFALDHVDLWHRFPAQKGSLCDVWTTISSDLSWYQDFPVWISEAETRKNFDANISLAITQRLIAKQIMAVQEKVFHHFRWLALFQCFGMSPADILDTESERPKDHLGSMDEATVRKAVTSTARLAGIARRRGKRGKTKVE